MSKNKLTKARVTQRFVARVIDQLIISIPFFLIAYIFKRFALPSSSLWWNILNIANLLIDLIYFVFYPLRYHGQTIAKKLAKIKIVSADSNKLSKKQLFIRELFLTIYLNALPVLGAILNLRNDQIRNLNFISFLLLAMIAIFNQEGKTLHDLVAGTKVVNLESKS